MCVTIVDAQISDEIVNIYGTCVLLVDVFCLPISLMNCEYFSVCVCCYLIDVSVPRRVILERNTCTKVFTISSEISEIVLCVSRKSVKLVCVSVDVIAITCIRFQFLARIC